MQNNVILENSEEQLVTEVDEDITRKKEKENKKQNDLKRINKKRHYSQVDYPKVQTFAGKLELDLNGLNDLNTNEANMIHKAKNSVIKEKSLKKELSRNASTSSQIKLLNIRDSYLKFYQLNPNKIRQSEVIKTNRLPNMSALKPTPYQKREEEFFKYKNLIDLKQRSARIKDNNLIFDYSNIVKKIRLNSENKHKDSLTLKLDKLNPSTSSKNHTKNNSIVFKNSPSNRNSSVTIDYSSALPCFDILHLKNKQLSTYNKFNLSEIKSHTKNNSTISSSYLSYEPKKKEKFLMPNLYK